MSKYTPGPWIVEINDTHTSVEAKHYTVAADVTNEDAALIAAAPDMLAALKKIADHTEEDDQYTYDLCVRMIAKVEGKTQ